MGILQLSPANVKMIRDVILIGIIGAIAVIGIAYAVHNLQQSLTLILPE